MAETGFTKCIFVGIRSASFQGNVLTIGTGVGILLFYDLRAGKYLESSINSSRTVHLKASKGWVVSIYTLQRLLSTWLKYRNILPSIPQWSDLNLLWHSFLHPSWIMTCHAQSSYQLVLYNLFSWPKVIKEAEKETEHQLLISLKLIQLSM